MLLGRPGWPARHSIWVNVAGGARCDYIGVGEEVGVHIDELLVGVGDAHDDRLVGGRRSEAPTTKLIRI